MLARADVATGLPAGRVIVDLGTAPMGETWGVAIDAGYFYFAASPTLGATES